MGDVHAKIYALRSLAIPSPRAEHNYPIRPATSQSITSHQASSHATLTYSRVYSRANAGVALRHWI